MNGFTTSPARPEAAAPTELLPLTRVRSGASARVRALSANPDVACRLRELGICEGQCVVSLGGGDRTICLVRSARLALSGRLADCVLVEAATEDVERSAAPGWWERALAACSGLLRFRRDPQA